MNPSANRDGHHPAPPPRASVRHLAAAIERPHQQRDRPHDDGLDIPEQVAERGPETNERGHDADSPRRPVWAKANGCCQLKVETQNINVRACGFYTRHGCELRVVHHAAYPALPEETQLLWYKDLRIAR